GHVDERIGRLSEAFAQGRLEVLGPDSLMVTAPMVGKRGGIMVLGIARYPMMDTDAAGAEQPCDRGGRRAARDFEDSQGTAKEAGIVRRLQLGFEPVALSGRQVEFAHRNTSTGSVSPGKISVKFQLSTRLDGNATISLGGNINNNTLNIA